MDIEATIVVIFYGMIGYLGGWLFKVDSHLRERYGVIAAFFIVYVAFSVLIFSSAQVFDLQNGWITAAYASGFIYRFFIYHG